MGNMHVGWEAKSYNGYKGNKQRRPSVKKCDCLVRMFYM